MTLTLNGTTGIVALDNSKVKLGTGGDLEIYHDGSNSYVDDAGTGRLYLRGNDRVQIQKYTGEDMITAIADGAAKLYYDNANKLETIATGVNITGGIRLGGNNAVNELDDYEEGTWTPSFKSANNNLTFNGGSATDSNRYLTQSGSYVKIGKKVFCSVSISTADVTSVGGGGNIYLQGLPFASNTTATGAPRGVNGAMGGRWNSFVPAFLVLNSAATNMQIRSDFETQATTSSFSTTGSSNRNVIEGTIIYNVS